MVQWLGLCAFRAEVLGSIPGRRTKIPQAAWHGQRKKKDSGKQKGNELSRVPKKGRRCAPQHRWRSKLQTGRGILSLKLERRRKELTWMKVSLGGRGQEAMGEAGGARGQGGVEV